MNRINVPIIKVGEKTSIMKAMTAPKLIGLFVLMTSSVLLGAFVEGHYTFLGFLRFPHVDPKTQLSAVGASLPSDTQASTNTPDTSTIVSDASTSAPVLTTNLSAPLFAIDNTPSQERIDNLNVLVSEHRDAVAQLNKELELIKDRSVTLIAEFDQNCGNWKDECATPFVRELELNNSRYSQLISKLATFNQELAKAESERTLLTQ